MNHHSKRIQSKSIQIMGCLALLAPLFPMEAAAECVPVTTDPGVFNCSGDSQQIVSEDGTPGADTYYIMSSYRGGTAFSLDDGDDRLINHGDISQAATASVYGQGGDDVLINQGIGRIFDGGAGADLVTNGGQLEQIVGGDGRDTLENLATCQLMAGGGDNDFIINHGDSAEIRGGGGDDSLKNFAAISGDAGAPGLMAGGAGDDTIRNFQGASVDELLGDALAAGETGVPGNDNVGNYGTARLIDGGPGNDIVFNYGTLDSDGTAPAGLRGGTGDDLVFVRPGAATNGPICGDDCDPSQSGDPVADGHDVLYIDLKYAGQAEIDNVMSQLENADPESGSFVMAGNTYQYQGFEQISFVLPSGS